MTPAFWRDKKVLVTGHTGFKGGWLCLWLQQLGARVTGYSLSPPSEPNLFTVARVGEGMVSLNGDVRDLQALQSAVQSCQSEIVIHMAAQSLVRCSYQNPVETYATNVMGTVNILETARRERVRAVLVVTSDKCYENRESSAHGYREEDPMGGYDPYSSSKGCAELVTAAYRSSYFNESQSGPTAIASARAGNVIGGGDWAQDRLLPDVIRAFARGQSVLIRRPGAVRPWQHVLEPLRGYLELIERLWEQGASYAEAWNFGSDSEEAKPVSWIADRLVELWGNGASWEHDNAPQPHEAGYLKLECAKAKARLGWYPSLTLAPALEWSVAWYKTYYNNENMRRYSLDQIGRYQNMTNK